MTTTRPLEILHMDLFGPQNYASFGGSHYGLVIVDDFSQYTWVFFSKTRLVLKISSKASPRRPRMSMMWELSMPEVTMEPSSKILVSINFSMIMVLLMSSLSLTLPNRMELLSERIELSLKRREQCLVSIKLLFASG